MKIEGGCYCKQVRYESTGDIGLKGQCFCRECQYISGGDSVLIVGVPEDGFKVTSGELKEFRRDDLDSPVTREFCPNCGTQIASLSPTLAGAVLLKVGTLDDPSVFEGPQMAIFTCDSQSWHTVPEGIPSFERMPG